MSVLSVFQRGPRQRPGIPKGEVEIPAPPAPPTRQAGSLIAVLLPGLMAVGGLIFTISMAATANLGMSLLSFGFMGITAITTLVTYITQNTAYTRAVNDRQTKYRALLGDLRQNLSRQREQQQLAMREIDPDPQECLARVEHRNPRLWERALQEPDFLSVRLGVGQQSFGVSVKTPKQQNPLEPDPLIQEAETLAMSSAQVSDVPICLPLSDVGVAGLAGPRYVIVQAARALALQIATHHSPDEVKIVAVFPGDEREQWDWLRWLPHTWDDERSYRFLACEKGSAHKLLDYLDDLLKRRKPTGTMPDASAVLPLPHFVFFFADPGLQEKEPILSRVQNEAKTIGAFSIFLADRIDGLPRNCQATVQLDIGQTRLLQKTPVSREIPFDPDQVPVGLADRLARRMSPIRLQHTAGPTGIPNIVTLLDLLGVANVEDLDAPSRWRASEPSRSLAVPIGRRTIADNLLLDLHERGHGPHGLLAGATGSGKGELLQALILSLATHFSPLEIGFVLLDFKGGDMANPLRDLPHVLSILTDLEIDEVPRALASLEAEIERRERIFKKFGIKNITDYLKMFRQKQVSEPLPYLILIVDEFKILKEKSPDYLKKFVNVAVVGRSLGFRMILSTQKPAGVVDEQIWANSRFRICLRVERPEDSQEVLKRPDAASLTRTGRAYFQVGTNEVFELFQAAWGGAPYMPNGNISLTTDEVVEVALDGTRHSLRPISSPPTTPVAANQLQALVTYLQEVAAKEGVQRLSGPWMPHLPKVLQLDMVRPRTGWDGLTWIPDPTWLAPIVGLIDHPAQQSQVPLSINLGKEGHLAIYGAPGTGKTTFIQTLVSSLVLSHSPQDLNLYLLDFGSRLLTLFTPLPHIGGVVLTGEVERLNRLMHFLLRELESRKERFTRAGVGNLLAYRSTTGEVLPAIVVILDNYAAFASSFADNEDQLAQLAREGGNLGIYLVLTATSPTAVKTKVSGNITMAVALQLADPSEYSSAVGRTGGLLPAPYLGRGLVKGTPPLEFQTALPIQGASEAERNAALKNLIGQMASQWHGPRARPVPMLPDIVPLSDLIVPSDTWTESPVDRSLKVPLALETEDLEPLSVDLQDGPHFCIAGPVQSGKTTLLQSWLLALAERFPPARLQLYLVDFRRAGLVPFERLPHVRAFAQDDDQLSEMLAGITQMLRERHQSVDQARGAANGLFDERARLAQYPALVVAMDDLDAIKNDLSASTKERLEQLIRRERGTGFHILLCASTSDLTSAWDSWVKALKEMQTGFLIGSSDHSDLSLFNLRLPMAESGKSLTQGEGFYARRGHYRKIKAASSQAGVLTLTSWVEKIRQRSAQS